MPTRPLCNAFSAPPPRWWHVSSRRACGNRSSRGLVSCAPRLETTLQSAARRLLPTEASGTLTVSDTTIGPGQHTEHYRVDTGVNHQGFLCKVSRRGGLEALEGEAISLSLLNEAARENDRLHVPLSLATGTILTGLRSYSILPFLRFAPFGSSIPSVQADLGASIARIHLHSIDNLAKVHKGRFGFNVPTYLGGSRQENAWSDVGDWLGFFVSQRLEPRLREALDLFGESWGTNNESAQALRNGFSVCNVDVLRPLFDGIIVRPSLLHGDLFMGNCGALSTGRGRRACVFDPASYFGHHELDLALSTMWGSFLPVFHTEYHNILPQEPGFAERQELYRLYYLLSMLVLHGPGFGSKGTTENPDGYMERCARSLSNLEDIFGSS